MKVMSLPVYPAADTTSSARTITLAITGASGIVFARHMLQCLEADPRIAHIYLVASPSSLRVLAEEDGVIAKNNLAEKLLGRASEKIQHLAHEDIGAPIASGSCPVSAMIILPCSMGTLGGIAHGLAANLIERAADVCLKERRPLILCVRETPFNRIHLRNMQLAADAGATIFPVMPTLYSKPQSTSEMAIQFVQRVLAHIGLAQPGAYQWQADGRPD
jgi:4-hydroxy-3-polyprenylbenzoate decarboxylase